MTTMVWYELMVVAGLALGMGQQAVQPESELAPEAPPELQQGKDLPYDLNNPDLVIYPGSFLENIVGLDIYSDREVAIVPESPGIIYMIDHKKSKISGQWRTVSRGKTSGLAIHSNTVFQVKTNGMIYGKRYIDTRKPKTLKTNPLLPGKTEPYGLAMDRRMQRLLLVCKNPVVQGVPMKNYCGVYRFNPYTRQDSSELICVVDLRPVNKAGNPATRSMVYGTFNTDKDRREKPKLFSPSGLGLHPVTDELYILSAESNQLIVTNQEGELQHMVKLDDELFQQCEAMTIGEDGMLYISTVIEEQLKIYGFRYLE